MASRRRAVPRRSGSSRGRGPWFRVLLPLLFSLAPTAGWAQPPAPPSLSAQSEERILLQDIPSVYSASKYEQKVTEAPSSVSIVTAEEIKRYGYRTLADILRSIRGFYITYDRNYTYLGVRGFARSGDWNARTLVLVDGHRLNEAVYDSVLIGTEFIVDVDLIDRVEIVRGPSSSLYGNNAFFAVVNVITRRGRDLQGPEPSASAGSFDTYTGRLSYGQRFQNGLEPLLSGSYLTSGGQRRLFFPEFDDPGTNNGVAVHRDGDEAYSGFGKLSWRDLTLEAASVSRTKEIPTAAYGTIFNDPRAETTDQRGFVDLRYEPRLGMDWRGLGRLFYDRYYYGGRYPYALEGDATVLNRDTAVAESWGGELQLVTRALSRHTLTLGGEFRHDLRQDQRNWDEDPFVRYLDDRRDSLHWGVYGQDEFVLLPRLTFNGGVRYDYFESSGDSINPRLALIYNPLDDTILKVLYGTAFRAPNVYERYYTTFLQKGNANLKPERITTYELILEQYLGKALRGTIVGFYYTIDDLVNLVTDPADGLLVFQNTQSISAKGVEVELEGRWSNGVLGRVSYTYQRVEDDRTGEGLPDSPAHVVKLNLSVPLIREKLFAGLEVQYTSERKLRTDKALKGFFLANATLLSVHLPVKGLEASASVYNLFDYRYSDPASEEHQQSAIEQDGRSFRVKLTYSF